MGKPLQIVGSLDTIYLHYLSQVFFDVFRKMWIVLPFSDWVPPPLLEVTVYGRYGGAMRPCLYPLRKQRAVMQSKIPALGIIQELL